MMLQVDEDVYARFIQRSVETLRRARMDLRDGGRYSRMTLPVLRSTVTRLLQPTTGPRLARVGGIQRMVQCTPSMIRTNFPLYGPEILDQFWTVSMTKQESGYLYRMCAPLLSRDDSFLRQCLRAKYTLRPTDLLCYGQAIQGLCRAYTIVLLQKRPRIPVIGIYARMTGTDVHGASGALSPEDKTRLSACLRVDRDHWVTALAVFRAIHESTNTGTRRQRLRTECRDRDTVPGETLPVA